MQLFLPVMSELSDLKDISMQQQIIQAAQQLFQRHGLHKVTMDDVAKEIGKRRSSLYYYYKSKEEILDAAIDVEMREMIGEITQAVNQAVGLEARLQAYFTARLKISQKRWAVSHMVDNPMNADEISAYEQVKLTIHLRFRELELPLLRSILAKGIEEKTIRPIDAKEMDTLISLIRSCLRGFKRDLTMGKKPGALKPEIGMMVEMILSWLKR